MDSTSAASLAEELGTSVPRVVRAIERLSMEGARAANGRLRLTKAQRRRLGRHLGVTPRIDGLTQSEVRALAPLRAAPLGLASARALAGRAGLSPTTASKTLRSLEGKGLVRREKQTIAAGRARETQVWLANVLHPDWASLAAALSRVAPPERTAPQPPATRVPPRLRHLFWDAKPSSLRVDRNGAFIALRLLRLLDPEGLAWGVSNLRPSDWRRAATARGISPPVRALAENLAADEVAPQRRLEVPRSVAGIRVAGLKDLLAMKLKVLRERGKMRDYFDVKAIDESGRFSVEEGIEFWFDRYGIAPQSEHLQSLVTSLGYLDDVEPDGSLPIGLDELAEWWRRRQRVVVRNLGRFA